MEQIEILNQRLIDHFGKFEDGQANWRIVWSEDQFELRYGTFANIDSSGNYWGEVTEHRKVPKYNQYLPNQYVLERILPTPEINRKDIITKTTYEPVWGFHDKDGNPLPPDWDVAKLVIDSVYTASAKAVGAKYKDPDSIPEEAMENERKRITKLQEELFGNESVVGDALAHKEAIVVP